jgi:hypothetical protein
MLCPMLDLPTVMAALSVKRPVFHSEADFQHALAWHLHATLPDADVRLECQPVPGIHLDVWLRTAEGSIAIELKYVTKLLSVDLQGERFRLANHGAQPPRRYDFAKDIIRLETVVEQTPSTVGHAVLLTNEPLYWTASKQANGIGAAFQLHEGRSLRGALQWGKHAAPGTMGTKSDPLVLLGEYQMHWRDFSSVNGSGPGAFRYLLVDVKPRALGGRHSGG